jgi:hypothetical protein
MKRRKFLKAVGGVTGATAFGVVSTAKTVAQPKRSSNNDEDPNGPAKTYGLEPTKPASDPFNRPVRPPFWYPDGRDFDNDQNKRIFAEEVVGLDLKSTASSKPSKPFGVEFEYKGVSKKWILGSKIANPGDAKDHENFTQLVRELAVKVRNYNASLYRLRRFHFCDKYHDNPKTWPHANPDGDPPDQLKPGTDPFVKLVKKAEENWWKVADELSDFLKTAKEKTYLGFTLIGADMIAVNGFIVSMRVVVTKDIREEGGSSSHVSISSPFSSSLP